MELSGSASSLTPLREELSIHPAAPGPDGDPRWVIEDPVTHRFHEFDWSSFEILQRWSMGQPEAIIQSVNADTALTLTTDDVASVYEHLSQSKLLLPSGGQALFEEWHQSQRPWLTQLLHNYLFFRIPLIRPDVTLKKLSPFFNLCYQPVFWYSIIFIACLGLFLVTRQWEQFVGTFANYGQWQDWIWFGVALAISKCLHELGHALSAHRYGCRVPTMGMAFLVLWPVLYTDTNEVWKLQSRRARLVISASGMAAELALASLATLAWTLTPEGPLRSALFFLASTAWLITLGINLNPFMRFDGYFLLSDWLRQPNMHGRAFAIGRWRLRKFLFGFDDAPPEAMPASTRRFMMWFAFGTWLYRLVLFLGIALMVYHLFFKLLGIFLMVVELIWFIGRPINNELKIWWQRRSEIRSQRRTWLPIMLLLCLLTALLWPWSHRVQAPALIKPVQQQTFYATAAAQTANVHVTRGSLVEAGQLLFTLKSPDLDYQLLESDKEISLLQWQLDHQTSSERLLQQGDLIRERLAQARAERWRLKEQQGKLAFHAPFGGTVIDINQWLNRKNWIAEGEPLITVAQPGQVQVEILVEETDLGRLDSQQPVTLYPDQPEQAAFSCLSTEIETLALTNLSSGHLASVYGGPVAVNPTPDGRLVPNQAVYRLTSTQCNGAGLIHEQLATAHLVSTPYSLLSGLWRRVKGIYIRETGF